MLSHSKLALLVIAITFLTAPIHVQAQGAKGGAIRQIEVPIPMGTALIYPTPAGRYVVCVRGFTSAAEVGGTKVGPCVRVAVVDLSARKVIAQEDLPPHVSRFGVCDDYVLIADKHSKEVVIKSIQDLAVRKVVPAAAKIESFVVIPGKLICTGDGLLRLDYKSLEESQQWKPLGDKDKILPVIQYHDGWLIDGVLWNKTLDKPLLLLGFPHRKDFKMEMDAWEKLAGGRAFNLDYPIAARLETEPDVKVKIETLGGEPVGEVSVPAIEPAAGDWQLLSDMRPQIASDSIFQCGLMKNRLYIACNGKLTACDLSQLGLDKLSIPFQIVRQQSTFVAPYGVPTKFSHQVLGAPQAELKADIELGPGKKTSAMEFEFDLKPFVNGRPNSNDFEYTIGRQPQDLHTRLPDLLKRLNIDHAGPLFPERVWTTATITNAAGAKEETQLGYYVLSAIRAEDFKAFLDYKVDRDQKREVALKRQAERLEVERKAQAEVDKRKQASAEFNKATSGVVRMATGLFTLILVPIIFLVPIFVISLGKDAKGKRNLSYLTGIIATLPLGFCAYQLMTMASRLPGQPMPATLIPPQMFLFSVIASMLFLLMACGLGAALMLQSKGYDWKWSLVLGWIGPMGYFISLLLPAKSQPAAATAPAEPPVLDQA